ncbi:TRAP transporter small permease [Sulfitobacter sp. F26204]|uniref:TRAP transporter small permease subunit n=1 Tax=Sulfitobacter sp. F26204 TaxID=2996014 RepID=UPI00225E59AC|nr:TRAP transporter small permease [Sulfitobacter sp. F26204]MCX7560935.1 TRAP transporter small permease [Sulfitobacter sp. F26204]
MPSRLLAALDLVTLAANVLGSLLIVSLVGLITADVAGRNLLGAPLSGVPELVSLSIVAIVFLQAPQALKAGRMTRSDGMIDILHKRVPTLAKGLETAFDLVGVLVLLAILYAHWPMMIRSWLRSDFVGAIGDFTAPTWPIKTMLTLGCILLALQFIARIIRRFVQ